MAQAEFDGELVTFTNVQKDGTEYSLYVNDQGALTISLDPAANLGEYAQFTCTLRDNGKYTFYNEKAGVYMIWRDASTGGYDDGDGTMETYNSIYCDWTLKKSTKYNGGYYIVSKRSNGTSDGSLVILKNGVFDAYGDSEGWADGHTNIFRIAKVNVGETIEITYKFSYKGDVKEEYTSTVVAEVGEVFPTAPIVFPYGITAIMPDGEVEKEDAGKIFTIELEDNLPFVAAESYESITHWYYMTIHATSPKYLYHEAGQTYIPLNQATKPAAAAKYAWAFVGNPFDGYAIYNYAAGADMVLSSSTTMSGSNGGGTYPVMTATPVANGNTYWVVTESNHGTNGFYLGQKGYANNRLNNRDNKLAYWTGGADAGSTFMVERCIVPDGYYRIAYDHEDVEYYLQGVASTVKGCAFTQDTDAASVWYYGSSKLLSYSAGKYIKEDGNTRGLQGVGVEGGDVTIAASTRDAGKYTVKCSSYLHFNVSNGNYFGDHCGSEGGHATHDMILENVMSLPVTIFAAGWATFYAPVAVKVADGVTAYSVKVKGDWADLAKIEDGVIPANTGVILQGDEDTYNFVVTNTTATVESDLTGTAAATNVNVEAYVLGKVDGVVGLYKAEMNGTSWLNNSHKAYLPASVVPNKTAAFYGFNWDGTTGVENVEVENVVKTIYDLTGRKVETISAPGIYIINGVKRVVR